MPTRSTRPRRAADGRRTADRSEVRQVGVQRCLGDRPGDDGAPGRASDRGQPDQQQEAGQHQHLAAGVAEVAVHADDQYQGDDHPLQHGGRLRRRPAHREEPEREDREPRVVAEVQPQQVVAQRQPDGQERRREREGARRSSRSTAGSQTTRVSATRIQTSTSTNHSRPAVMLSCGPRNLFANSRFEVVRTGGDDREPVAGVGAQSRHAVVGEARLETLQVDAQAVDLDEAAVRPITS